MDTPYQYHARGKLLLSGEYFVLDGATALAVPTVYGQHFRVDPLPGGADSDLRWTMQPVGRTLRFDAEDWAEAPGESGADPVRHRLLQLFHAAEALAPGCTQWLRGRAVTTTLEFEPAWGLGSSSTLVAFLADYLDVNPYALLERTFGGSGYDLACADAAGPIFYTRQGTTPRVTELDWHPSWLATTCFVYRNVKQDSREALDRYGNIDVDEETIWEAGQLSRMFLQASHLRAAARIATAHERLVADHLGLTPVREELFPEFDGEVKSLGAWGGDFVWALTDRPVASTRKYFNDRGYATVIPYDEMVYYG